MLSGLKAEQLLCLLHIKFGSNCAHLSHQDAAYCHSIEFSSLVRLHCQLTFCYYYYSYLLLLLLSLLLHHMKQMPTIRNGLHYLFSEPLNI